MNLNDSESIKYREVNLNDLFLIYGWRNEKKVVQNSLSKKKITINEHRTWFNKIIKSENNLCLIFSYNGKEFGLVRFFLHEDSAEINYLICEKFRGRKLSKSMLTKSIIFLRSKYEIKQISAKVLKKNIISSRVLEDISFKQFEINDEYANYILIIK